MAFAAGVLVATALADLLPEATGLIGPDANPVVPGAAAVLGFLLFSALEAFVHRETWEHEHQRAGAEFEPSDPHARLAPAPNQSRPEPGRTDQPDHPQHPGRPGDRPGFPRQRRGRPAGRPGRARPRFRRRDERGHPCPGQRWPVSRARASCLRSTRWRRDRRGDGHVRRHRRPACSAFCWPRFSGVFLAVGAGHLLPEAYHQRPGASPTAGAAHGRWARGLVLIIRSVAG